MEICQASAKPAGSQRTGAQVMWKENLHECWRAHTQLVLTEGPLQARALIGGSFLGGSAREACGPFTTDNISLHELGLIFHGNQLTWP